MFRAKIATYQSLSLNFVKNLVEDARIEIETFYNLRLIDVEAPVYYPLYALSNVIEEFVVKFYEVPDDYKRRLIRFKKEVIKDPYSSVRLVIVKDLEDLDSKLEHLLNNKKPRTSILLVDAFLPLSHKVDIYEKALEYNVKYLPALKPGDVEEQIEKLKEHGIYELFIDMAVFGPETVERIRRDETITYVYDSIINTRIYATLYKESMAEIWSTFVEIKDIKDTLEQVKSVKDVMVLFSEGWEDMVRRMIMNKPTYDITKKVFISALLGSPLIIKRKNHSHRVYGIDFLTASL